MAFLSQRTHLLTGVTFALAVSLLLLGLGCDGLQGPPGLDADEYDHHPPAVSLLHPNGTTEIIGDTLTLSAHAVDTLGQIEQVEFLVNGSNTNGSEIAILPEEPYRFLWDFSADATPYGIVSIQVVARDTAGNRQATPLLLLNRVEYSGMDTLQYWVYGAEESLWPIPAAHEVFDEDGQVTDTTTMDRLGSRFTSRADGDLVSAGFFFVSNSNYTTPDQLWVVVYDLDDQFSPNPLDSILVPFGEDDLNRWWDVDLSGLNDGAPYIRAAGESFLVVARLDESDVTVDSGVLLTSSVLSLYPEDRRTDHGWMNTELLGWETLGEHYVEYGEFRPKMRAVMDYTSGSSR